MDKKIIYTFVSIILKAIHNKDYSVVKTFGSPLVHNQEAFFMPNVSRTPIKLLKIVS